MSRFKVGDRVVIVRGRWAERIGQVATVVTSARQPLAQDDSTPWWPERGLLGHELDLAPLPVQPTGGPVWYPIAYLEPYRPDHNEKAEWTDELRKLCGMKERKSA